MIFFTLTLINGRKSLNYNEVSAALTNYDTRRQDRLSSHASTSAEALAVRGRCSYRKGKGDREIEVQARFQKSEEEPVCLL